MNDFKSALANKQILESNVTATSTVLNAFPSGPMGLTPDAVKFSEAFKQAKANYNHAAKTLKDFNGPFLKFIRKNMSHGALNNVGNS